MSAEPGLGPGSSDYLVRSPGNRSLGRLGVVERLGRDLVSHGLEE